MKKITWLRVVFMALACLITISIFAAGPLKKKAIKKRVDCTSCTAISQKCINNVCETGTKVWIGSGTQADPYCGYYYLFSDGTKKTVHISPCFF